MAIDVAGPNENDIAVALIALFEPYLAAHGYPVNVVQMQQPTQQGQPDGIVLFFQRLAERRVGWPQRADVYDVAAGDFAHVESTQFEVTYQFNAFAPPVDPANLAPPTVADILRAASFAIQSDRGRKVLRAAGLGVLRVTDLRLGYALDDRDQNEAEPSFDAVLTYRNTFTDRVGLVTETEVEIHRV